MLLSFVRFSGSTIASSRGQDGSSELSVFDQSRVSIAPGHQFMDLFDTCDIPPRPGSGAVQGCGCTSEIEHALEGPALKQAVNKAGMENVTCPGGVDGGHSEGRGVKESLSVPGKHAVSSES